MSSRGWSSPGRAEVEGVGEGTLETCTEYRGEAWGAEACKGAWVCKECRRVCLRRGEGTCKVCHQEGLHRATTGTKMDSSMRILHVRAALQPMDLGARRETSGITRSTRDRR